MRKFLLLASSIAALAGVTALPAGSATPATFQLIAGTLSISTPTASVSLGSQVSCYLEHDVRPAGRRQRLRLARRHDDLDGLRDFDCIYSPGRPGRPGEQRQLCVGHITASAGVVATPVAASNLTGVTTVVTGTSTGVSSASWNPTISVLVPANFAPGEYAATITHSVA